MHSAPNALWTLELERIAETQGLLDLLLTQVEKFTDSNDTEFSVKGIKNVLKLTGAVRPFSCLPEKTR